MNKPEIEVGKSKQERACALCFLNWYNEQNSTNYLLKRAEEVSPKLSGRTRWEFVASEHQENAGWFAIEVKGLVIPQSRRQFMDWNKFFERVSKDLDCSLKGTFAVIGPPALTLNQREQSQLRSTVVQVIFDVSPRMKKDEKLDLGPSILQQFPDWPFTPHVEMKPKPHIVQNAHEMWLFKTSDSGCSVELCISPAYIFNVQGAEQEAVSLIFKSGGEGAKANAQLGLAKQMGARETVLLLDCHLPYRPEVIRRAFANTDSKLMFNIDKIYLVSVSQQQVTDVTPSTTPS